MQISELADFLVGNKVVVLSIRPPLGKPSSAANWPVNSTDKWIVNFRELDQESVWHRGTPQPTLEGAMMDTLEKIEALLSNKNILHVAFGRTTAPGPTRFASIEATDREFYHGNGNTVSEAADAAMAQAEKGLTKKLKASAKPATRYFAHFESSCVFTTEDGSRPVGDGLVEEVDREMYLKLQREWAQPAEGEDPLADLLG